MIFDNLQNRNNYKSIPYIYRALQELKKLEGTFPESTIVYEEGSLFANPVTLTSKPESDCIFEAHKNFLDLHYIVEGVEGIATADVTTLEEKIPYEESKDIGFYQGDADGIYYLKPGQFMICWPSDAHKVAVMQDSPAPIRKIVVKIRADKV